MTPQQKLIRRFVTMFGEPKTADPTMYLEEFAKALSGWTDGDVLDKAGDEIIRTSTFWPRPAEVNEAAHRIVAARFKPAAYPDPGDLAPPDPAAAARVRALVKQAAARIKERSAEAMGTDAPPDVSRPTFEAMQRDSPNPHLHRACPGERHPVKLTETDLMRKHDGHAVKAGITDLSKRMTGERSE